MPSPAKARVSRRDFNKLAVGAAAAGPFVLFSPRSLAGQKTLKIAKWAHFLPQYDAWFDRMAMQWGQQHDTKITVDTIPVEKIAATATTEVKTGKGHDVFMFPWSPAQYYQHAIDHTDIYQQVAGKYGSIPQLAHRSTFNLKNKTYFAFADFWAPSPLQFRQDYWEKVNMPYGPGHYGSLYAGGKHLREEFGVPCGLAFTPTLEGNITLHTLMYAFRAWILDGSGEVLFNKNVFAVGALQYLQKLYQDSGTPDQLNWGPTGSAQALLAGQTSCTTNAISLLRTAELRDSSAAGKIWLQPPLLGTNGVGVTALPHVTNCSVVWKFAQNQDSAKQFIADLIDSSRAGYAASLGVNFPTYPKTVPDLIVRLTKDPQADPGFKYTLLKDALHWTPNLGVPGFATPAYMEVFNSFLIPLMVQSVLKGERSPQDAAAAGAAQIARISDKWRQLS